LDAVRAQEPSGGRLVALFGSMYYSALRPEEVICIREIDVELPPHGDSEDEAWGTFHLHTVEPEVSSIWGDGRAPEDEGASTMREERQRLKHRAEGEIRSVPIPPHLVDLLRRHIDAFGVGPEGHLFQGVRARRVAPETIRRVWDRARQSALSSAEYVSPLGKRPYDLRHACVSTWLAGGVPPTQVAEWAGHSVEVLLKTYAKSLAGQEELAKQKILEALK
jgi:integrase